MKKLMQTLFALVLCTSATTLFGWDGDGSADGALRSDTSANGFYVGVTGEWVVPSETGLGTFTDSWQYANDDLGVNAKSKPSKAHYKGAGSIKVGYDFPCSANNVEVEYFHLRNNKHNVHDTTDGPVSFGSAFFDLGVPLTPGQEFVSDSHLKYNLNQFDIKVGHHFVAGCGNLLLHPTFGVRYINLRHDLTFLVGNVKTHYHGAGPMLGFDGEYQFCGGFSFAGRFDASILMGSTKASSLLNFGAANRYNSPSTHRMVYTFGGKLGVAYNYVFCNQSSLKIELGYKAVNYIGPFDIISAITLPVARIGNLNTTSFGFSGPYLELTWHM